MPVSSARSASWALALGWRLTVSYSPESSLPGLSSTARGTMILPTSWSRPASVVCATARPSSPAASASSIATRETRVECSASVEICGSSQRASSSSRERSMR